jgi:hypothetical protein
MCLARDMAALWFTEITITAAARAGSRPRKKAMPHPRGSDGLARAGTLALEDFRREETRSR